MQRNLLIFAMAMLPGLAAAHPHIFIDVGLKLAVDDGGMVREVEVEWRYDAFYSLLILEDMGIASGFDGPLTPEDKERLQGFDLNWVEGYKGDIYLTQGEADVQLSQPEYRDVTIEDGQIVSRHARAVSVPADGLLVEAYDPTFYTQYFLADRVEVTSETCWAVVQPANVDAAYAALEELLFARPQSDLDDNFPEVGRSFADQVRLKC